MVFQGIKMNEHTTDAETQYYKAIRNLSFGTIKLIEARLMATELFKSPKLQKVRQLYKQYMREKEAT